jgi:hypothetical protein
LVRQGWETVYADSAVVVLVRPGADTAEYRTSRRIDLRAIAEPADLVPGPPELRRQQLDNFEALRRALAATPRSPL